MSRNPILGAVFAGVMICSQAAYAQTAAPAVPPENSKKLSEIVAKIEQRDQFRYIEEIDWDEDGFYQITYFTSDKAKVEIKVDPVTGEPK